MLLRRRVLRSLAVVGALFASAALLAQRLPAGPQVLTFFSDVDDSEQPYALYLPKAFNPAKKYPLVISLHGAGSNHRLNLRRVFGKSNVVDETDVEATRSFPAWRDVEYIVASPLARGTMGFQGIAEKDVYDVLADVKKRFPIDEDRVYLTGLSMGGGGTFWLGLTRPDVWAAIAPVCPAPPAGSDQLAPNALNVPVHIYQGGDDPVVRPEGTRQFVKRLQDLGTKVAYDEFPGVKHNSWENAYKDGQIFTWFAKFRRNRFPDRVRFASTQFKYDRAYWVTLDQLTPGTLASIDAAFTAVNRLTVTTTNLGAFTLHLKGHPKLRAAGAIEITIDGKALKVAVTSGNLSLSRRHGAQAALGIETRDAAGALSFSRRDGSWVAETYVAAADAKRKGAEGPIGEAIASRHIYVYGTLGNPTREELAVRRELATRAADWSSATSRLLLSLRVVADRDVRPSDLAASNLVLFGTRQTNSLIEKFADRLPIELNAGAVGYGFVYTVPVNGHYVVVCSGLPWWTTPPAATTAAAPGAAPASARRLRGRFMPGSAGALSGFEDYILFKDSLDAVIAEGRFDARWRLSAADAEKMRATGAVTVKRAGT
jgi:poly(3-hydroxybutyrate) depolymerase